MEVINDWGIKGRVPPQRRNRAPVTSLPDLAKAIPAALAGITPPVLNVHCYEDVGHPWVRVVFEKVIHPDVALTVGEALASVTGGGVYFNSLQPKAVSFLLEPAFDPQPDLPASRYGASLAEIKASWGRRSSASRRVTGA